MRTTGITYTLGGATCPVRYRYPASADLELSARPGFLPQWADARPAQLKQK